LKLVKKNLVEVGAWAPPSPERGMGYKKIDLGYCLLPLASSLLPPADSDTFTFTGKMTVHCALSTVHFSARRGRKRSCRSKCEWCRGKGGSCFYECGRRLDKEECGLYKDDSDRGRVVMGAEIGTHFEIALKTSLRENFFENFAILSKKLCAAEVSRAPTRNTTCAPGPNNQKSH